MKDLQANLNKAMEIFNIKVEQVTIEDGLSEEDKAMTQMILDNLGGVEETADDFVASIDEFRAQEELKVHPFELMVNEYKAQSKKDALDHMGLMQVRAKGFNTNRTLCTIDELVDFINNGQTIYCSVLNLVKNESVKDDQFVFQQVFGVDIDHTTMTLDELVASLPYAPTVIYNTFSHTEQAPRYRVLFISNDIVKDANHAKQIRQHLINVIPGADESCINASRAFYAGHVIYTNEYAAFNPFDIAVEDIAEPSVEDSTPNRLISEDESILEVIRENLKSAAIQELYGNRIVKTSYEINNIIYKIPLYLILGLDVKVAQKFNCVLDEHADENGSAHIQITKGGYYFYKCFGCNTTLYITDFISIEELLEILNIRTMWFEFNKDVIKYNRDIIANVNELKEQRPLTYARIKSYRKLLNALLDFAEEQLMHLGRTFATDKIDYVVFLNMYADIANKIGRTKDTVQNQLDILMLTSLLRKIDDKQLKEINYNMFKHNKSCVKSIDPKYNTQYAFIIYKWDVTILDGAEDMLEYYKSLGATVLGASQRQSQALGCDTRCKNKKSNNTAALITIRQDLRGWYSRTLNRNGFIGKKAYLAYAKSHKISERLASTFLVMFNIEFGLVKATVNEQLVKQYKTLTKKDYRKVIFIPSTTKSHETK